MTDRESTWHGTLELAITTVEIREFVTGSWK
jgi:hypothetical protein